ncbi:MAG: hypothetical protein AAF310_04885, partial [Myxococcota bacterium]
MQYNQSSMQRHTSKTPRRCSKGNNKPPRVIYRRDALFKAVATQPQVYRQIIKRHLPSKLVSKLDCAKAYLVNTSTAGDLPDATANVGNNVNDSAEGMAALPG